MTLKHIIISTIALLAAICASANDGVYYTRGNHLVPLNETDISIRKEVLTITLTDNGYAMVDVYYEFWNPATSTKRLLMGFEADPPYNDDYKFHPDGVHPNIKHFSVEMNGTPLPYRNAACLADTNRLLPVDITKKYYVFGNSIVEESKFDVDADEPIDFDAAISIAYVYYFDADFHPGLNRVHHTYSYKLSVIAGIPYHLEYKLSPAGRWAGGKIDDFTLNICAHKTAKHFFVKNDAFAGATFSLVDGAGKMRTSNHYDEQCTEVSLRNGTITLHINNFKPTEGHELSLTSADIYQVDTDGKYQFGNSYDRSSDVFLWVVRSESSKIEPSEPAKLKRVARNLPYAHRGHIFKDPFLKHYFESLWWYMPDPEYKDSDADFTDVDRAYIQFGK